MRPYAAPPSRTLDAVAGYVAGFKALNVTGDPTPVLTGVVSENLFDLLGVRPQFGRAFTSDDNRLGAERAVILSHELWTSQFGKDPGIVGRPIRLSENAYTVVGIMPSGFQFETGVKAAGSR